MKCKFQSKTDDPFSWRIIITGRWLFCNTQTALFLLKTQCGSGYEKVTGETESARNQPRELKNVQ